MKTKNSTGKLLVSALLSAAVAACGGGGGGGSSDGPLFPASLDGETPETSTDTSRSLGSGTGSDFIDGAIEAGVGNNMLSHNGMTSLAVNFVDENGALATDAIEVKFSSDCVNAGSAKLSNAVVKTSTGKATTSYTAAGCTGTDTVTAAVNYKGNALTAISSLNIAPENVQSISFVDAKPSLIQLKSTGGAETSVVRFRVLNGIGAPVKNACLNFSLNTSAGGVALANTKCASSDTLAGSRSDADGYVSVIVQAGNVATPVTITAREALSGVSTQSSGLRVSTGVPDQKGFSIALSKFNPSAWDTNNVTVDVSVLLSDAFNNHPIDGTIVSFRASGGAIQESCTTVNGGCSVKWRSQNPRPDDGRVVVMAHASGNESFIDTNGNGIYDFEAFTDTDQNGQRDLAEPFIDANKNKLYDEGEVYTDTNGNEKYDIEEAYVDANGNGKHDVDKFAANSGGCQRNAPPSSATNSMIACDDLNEAYVDSNTNGVHDEGEDFVDFNNSITFDERDGIYNGVLCSKAAEDFGMCSKTSVSIREDAVIVMSSKTPLFDNNRRLEGQPATISVPGTITVSAADFHGNTLPQGSVVSIVTNSASGVKVSKDSFTVPNSTTVQQYTFVLTRSNQNTAAGGSISFEITAPNGDGSGTTTTTTGLTSVN